MRPGASRHFKPEGMFFYLHFHYFAPYVQSAPRQSTTPLGRRSTLCSGSGVCLARFVIADSDAAIARDKYDSALHTVYIYCILVAANGLCVLKPQLKCFLYPKAKPSETLWSRHADFCRSRSDRRRRTKPVLRAGCRFSKTVITALILYHGLQEENADHRSKALKLGHTSIRQRMDNNARNKPHKLRQWRKVEISSEMELAL